MNKQRIKTIIIKDWKELLTSRQALIPLIILPVLFIVVMPLIIILSSGQMDINMSSSNTEFVNRIPQDLLPADYNLNQKLVYAFLVYMFAPFFMLIPVMVSSIIAANSFAGEKERKTIEGLLYTPVTDQELIIGKIAVSFIPSLIITWTGFLVYVLIVDIIGYPLLGRAILPNPTWLLLIFWISPLASFLSLALVVAVSQKAKSVWEAQQISVLMILPFISVVISQAAGVVYLNPPVVFLAGCIFLIIDIVIFVFIRKRFNREEIVTKFI